jgi:hypothetical protein
MFDAGREPVEADWESVVLSASRAMQVGTRLKRVLWTRQHQLCPVL